MQGVGFRPFIFRLAQELDIKGFIKNNSIGVLIEGEAEKPVLDNFIERILSEKPNLAFIASCEYSFHDLVGYNEFEILNSESSKTVSAFILPDIAVCPDCLKEMNDPKDRRYLYPFINCTNCGPRFSIIEALPYDRINTSMSVFEMCPECRAEYENPANRRYHAQPIACPACGPKLEFWFANGKKISEEVNSVYGAASAINNGMIVALKGIGGFQLICDATNSESVENLRVRKRRIDKPFAVMCPDLESVEEICNVDAFERRLLLSPESPIVLLKRKRQDISDISYFVAPGNPYLGVMLPYSPLHHLIMKIFKKPIVATSGNLSEEPICIGEYEALERLSGIADYFLVHNRRIVRHVDDSVVRAIKGRTMVMRRARGYAPLPVEIKERKASEKTIISLGGHLKNTIAMKVGSNVFVSQHIGDLETHESLLAFEKVTQDFQNLYQSDAVLFLCDMHPDYNSTKYARNSGIDSKAIQHHVAHVASCRAENNVEGKALAISWDGTGFGTDGSIWGGEFFLTYDNSCTHVGSIRQFPLPGGELAIKEPRRSALGLLYEIFGNEIFESRKFFIENYFSEQELQVLKGMLNSRLNCPMTSSVGRLFDAVSSLLDIMQKINFEGQAAMALEFAADPLKVGYYKFIIDIGTFLTVDWQPIIETIIEEKRKGMNISIIAAKFHNTLVRIIEYFAEYFSEDKIVLSGGCFQNAFLLEKVINKLESQGYTVYRHQRVPTNDGGISLGQIAAANWSFKSLKNNDR